MPSTGPRVVCALWVTMATLAPTSALIRVDLPLFGAPISATKPQRLPAPARASSRLLSVMVGRLPHPLAQQHGERRVLLRGALAGAMAAFRGDAVDLHLGGEMRRVVGTFA